MSEPTLRDAIASALKDLRVVREFPTALVDDVNGIAGVLERAVRSWLASHPVTDADPETRDTATERFVATFELDVQGAESGWNAEAIFDGVRDALNRVPGGYRLLAVSIKKVANAAAARTETS